MKRRTLCLLALLLCAALLLGGCGPKLPKTDFDGWDAEKLMANQLLGASEETLLSTIKGLEKGEADDTGRFDYTKTSTLLGETAKLSISIEEGKVQLITYRTTGLSNLKAYELSTTLKGEMRSLFGEPNIGTTNALINDEMFSGEALTTKLQTDNIVPTDAIVDLYVEGLFYTKLPDGKTLLAVTNRLNDPDDTGLVLLVIGLSGS